MTIEVHEIELMAEISRLKGVIARNKARYQALQARAHELAKENRRLRAAKAPSDNVEAIVADVYERMGWIK
jgi:hypothetical protein